jgi:hypothetical protein
MTCLESLVCVRFCSSLEFGRGRWTNKASPSFGLTLPSFARSKSIFCLIVTASPCTASCSAVVLGPSEFHSTFFLICSTADGTKSFAMIYLPIFELKLSQSLGYDQREQGTYRRSGISFAYRIARSPVAERASRTVKS